MIESSAVRRVTLRDNKTGGLRQSTVTIVRGVAVVPFEIPRERVTLVGSAGNQLRHSAVTTTRGVSVAPATVARNIGPVGPEGATGEPGEPGISGNDGNDGNDGLSVTVFQQVGTPTANRVGDVWIEP